MRNGRLSLDPQLPGSMCNQAFTLHIMGFDNIVLAHYLSFRLTTIDDSPENWCQALLDTIQGAPCAQRVIHASIFEGQSIGRPGA